MDFFDRLTDAELLARTAREPQAFAAFYRRHERLLLRFLMRRCRDAELTADIAAETFVRALEEADRFDPARSGGTSSLPWLLTIAHSTLVTSIRRGIVADDARRRLGWHSTTTRWPASTYSPASTCRSSNCWATFQTIFATPSSPACSRSATTTKSRHSLAARSRWCASASVEG